MNPNQNQNGNFPIPPRGLGLPPRPSGPDLLIRPSSFNGNNSPRNNLQPPQMGHGQYIPIRPNLQPRFPGPGPGAGPGPLPSVIQFPHLPILANLGPPMFTLDVNFGYIGMVTSRGTSFLRSVKFSYPCLYCNNDFSPLAACEDHMTNVHGWTGDYSVSVGQSTQAENGLVPGETGQQQQQRQQQQQQQQSPTANIPGGPGTSANQQQQVQNLDVSALATQAIERQGGQEEPRCSSAVLNRSLRNSGLLRLFSEVDPPGSNETAGRNSNQASNQNGHRTVTSIPNLAAAASARPRPSVNPNLKLSSRINSNIMSSEQDSDSSTSQDSGFRSLGKRDGRSRSGPSGNESGNEPPNKKARLDQMNCPFHESMPPQFLPITPGTAGPFNSDPNNCRYCRRISNDDIGQRQRQRSFSPTDDDPGALIIDEGRNRNGNGNGNRHRPLHPGPPKKRIAHTPKFPIPVRSPSPDFDTTGRQQQQQEGATGTASTVTRNDNPTPRIQVKSPEAWSTLFNHISSPDKTKRWNRSDPATSSAQRVQPFGLGRELANSRNQKKGAKDKPPTCGAQAQAPAQVPQPQRQMPKLKSGGAPWPLNQKSMPVSSSRLFPAGNNTNTDANRNSNANDVTLPVPITPFEFHSGRGQSSQDITLPIQIPTAPPTVIPYQPPAPSSASAAAVAPNLAGMPMQLSPPLAQSSPNLLPEVPVPALVVPIPNPPTPAPTANQSQTQEEPRLSPLITIEERVKVNKRSCTTPRRR